jgi:molybdate transport system permease protein
MDTAALLLTLRLAATTTVVLLLIALPLAWWIAFSHTKARFIVQALATLPLVLPPTVIGFYLLVALGPLTPIGRFLIGIFGHPLAFSFTGLVIGSVIYSLPFAIQPLVNGFTTIDKDLIETASTLGASPFKVFTSITLPLARPALLTSVILAFTHTVGEFGVVLMLGGDIPGSTRTLSIALYNQVQDFNYREANHTALVLLGFSFIALLLIYLRPSTATRRDLV